MTGVQDPELSRWERGERRRSVYIAILAGVVLTQSSVIGWLAFGVNDLTSVLNRRSPVIERIDEAEAETECTLAHMAVFLVGVGGAIEGAVLEGGDPLDALPTIIAAEAKLDAIAEGANPCELPLDLP